MSVFVFFPDVPEFAALVGSLHGRGGCVVSRGKGGYWVAEAPVTLRLDRKELRLGPAIWNSVLCGGFRGRITRYERDELCLESEQAP